MRTYLLLLLLFPFGVFGQTNSLSSVEPEEHFIQCMFNIESLSEVERVSSALKNSPFIEMVRLDFYSQQALIYTTGASSLTVEGVKSWFLEYGETVYCVNIGVRNVDPLKKFPFENCNN